ncbi:replication restart helicase PriA [Estrella lausannensis]|uniref:Replication restart protein PriA n=1 Tax=Estrella lausannensis TaxID=483423 RepID=A0A0H5DPI7_9BACT|nr:primosomal protein N' [Estrella lausannensis]CRX38481.1 Primosomal protein N' [Estrella lausannensis]
MKNAIALVALDTPLQEALDYSIPAELNESIEFGTLVEVPLRGRKCSGWVIGFKEKSQFKGVKAIAKVLSSEPALTEEVYKLAEWVARYYVTPLPKVLKTIIPSSLRKITKPKLISFVQKAVSKEELRDLAASLRGKSKAKTAVLDVLLLAGKEILLSELLEKAGTAKATVDALEKMGCLKVIKLPMDRSPLKDEEFFKTKPKVLNGEQLQALNNITQDIDAAKFTVHLLHGITGSGKTEIYMQAIEKVLERGGGVLVLVPEISLTAQAIDRFKSRFSEQIAILHHRLSDGERFDAWHNLKKGKSKIALGARSAVFAPVKNLKLIIVDEEHEPSYKQTDEMPCYHARDVAVLRGSFEKVPVILGSATPSLESYYNASLGKYSLSTLSVRAGKSSLPEVTVIDMRKEYERAKGYTIFSEILLSKIRERKEKGEQTILFLNRRGFHTSCMCQSCGAFVKCKSCDQAMTYHKKELSLNCHLCGFSLSPPPTSCPSCGRPSEMKFKGVGTEQVERALKALFPDIRTLRIDADTTRHKGSHEKLFKEFATHKADVLIGTQMVAKGLHFPLVTLVGVLNCDQTLQFPDFKAQETTFQLITQVSGRAGRSFHRGEVILQSCLVDHPILKLAQTQDFKAFYQEEIAIREMFSFPPLRSMAKVRLSGTDDRKTEEMLNRYRDLLLALLPKEYTVMPVAPSGHLKVKDRYYYQFFLLGPQLNAFRESVKKLKEMLEIPTGYRLHLDINPYSTYF